MHEWHVVLWAGFAAGLTVGAVVGFVIGLVALALAGAGRNRFTR